MSLAFLSPESAATARVAARSPMEPLALAAGGRLAVQEGWNVVSAYTDAHAERERLTSSVGFADRSSLTKLELQGAPDTLARVVGDASGGLVLTPGLASPSAGARPPGAWWCPVTPGRVIVLAQAGAGAGLRAALARAAERHDGRTTVLDVSCGLAALALVGPGARELLARFCAIDVRGALTPPGSFRPGSIARTPGYLLVEAQDRLLVLIGWALGEYLWRVVADAAGHLGGGPVGAAALAAHIEADDA